MATKPLPEPVDRELEWVSRVADPVPNFLWRSRGGSWHKPTDMETRHLFFTVRMIWNHSAPAIWRLEPYKKYRFGAAYTSDYMRLAVKHMLAELRKRDDIHPRWRDQLNFMCRKAEGINDPCLTGQTRE